MGKLLLEVASLKVSELARNQLYNQIYLITCMQNTSNDTKHKYKVILRSILIRECAFYHQKRGTKSA